MFMPGCWYFTSARVFEPPPTLRVPSKLRWHSTLSALCYKYKPAPRHCDAQVDYARRSIGLALRPPHLIQRLESCHRAGKVSGSDMRISTRV